MQSALLFTADSLRKRWCKIVDIEECHIQDKDFNKILDLVRTEAIKNEIKPYDNKTNNGYLRHLMLRKGYYTEELMVNIVTSYENPSKLKPITNSIINGYYNQNGDSGDPQYDGGNPKGGYGVRIEEGWGHSIDSTEIYDNYYLF